MTGWLWFAVAFATFLVSHRLPLRPAVRIRLVAMLGARGFTLAYSALSLVLLGWLIVAAGQAPYVPLWPRQPWQSWVPLTGMLGVCLLLMFGLARPNPFSFGGTENRLFDPEQPGIVRWVRHPALLALALWAGTHLLPNGDLSHVILFGIFTAFALIGMKIIDRQKQRQMGKNVWTALNERIVQGPAVPRPVSWRKARLRLALAGAIYWALITAHPIVIGVSPLP